MTVLDVRREMQQYAKEHKSLTEFVMEKRQEKIASIYIKGEIYTDTRKELECLDPDLLPLAMMKYDVPQFVVCVCAPGDGGGRTKGVRRTKPMYMQRIMYRLKGKEWTSWKCQYA